MLVIIYTRSIKILPVSSQTVSILPMKLPTLLLFTTCLVQISSFSYYRTFSLGLGVFTEHASKIEETPGGDTNSFEANPFVKAKFDFSFTDYFNAVFEAGLSTPRESRDSAVTRLNWWTNFLLESEYKNFRFNYGPGLFFTRLSMDGTPQVLNNGGVDREFQTPDSGSTASNLTMNVGVNYFANKDIFVALDVMALNPEDSLERAINYFFSVNILIDQVSVKK